MSDQPIEGVSVNEATGEVTVEIEGVEYRLKATFRNLAEYQRKVGVIGLGQLNMRLYQADMEALLLAMECLCISGNADKLQDITPIKHLTKIQGGLLAAVTWGLPDPEENKKKARPKRVR